LSKTILKKFKASAILALLLISVFGFLATKSETVKAADASIIGNTTIGTLEGSSAPSSIIGSRFEALSNFTIASVFWYGAVNSSTAEDVRVVIYTDAEGEPGTLLYEAQAVEVGSTAAWWHFAVDVQLTEDEFFWLCVAAAVGLLYYYSTSTSNQFASSTYSTSYIPSTFTSPPWYRDMSVYGTTTSSSIPEFSTSALVSVASAMAVITLCAVALAARKPKRTSPAST